MLPNVLAVFVAPKVLVAPNVPPVLVLVVLPNKLVVPVFVLPNNPPGWNNLMLRKSSTIYSSAYNQTMLLMQE